jgi:hypothetical protein
LMRLPWSDRKKRLTAQSRRRSISTVSALLFLFTRIFKGHTRQTVIAEIEVNITGRAYLQPTSRTLNCTDVLPLDQEGSGIYSDITF